MLKPESAGETALRRQESRSLPGIAVKKLLRPKPIIVS
jgi:hypothetical protein